MNAEALCRPISGCRACGGAISAMFCDLGATPLANDYPLPGSAPLPRYPLAAVVCGTCRMVQLDHVVKAEAIFTDYAYFSSFSESWLDHAARYAKAMQERLALGAQSFVVEIASNDGYLLRNFVGAGIPCLGVEPAANVAASAIAAGVPTEVRFFGWEAARDIMGRRGHADLVIANNVLAHVPDVVDFAAGLAHLAGPKGVVTIEAPHLLSFVDGVQFDTIYHEHYAYWSLYAVERLLAAQGLRVFDVEKLATHGGSLRYFASADATRPEAPGLVAARAEEAARGIAGNAFYQGFNARVAEALAAFKAWLAECHAAGMRLGAYGAAAKGNTFLNAAGVTAADFMAVADRNPAKQNRVLPGSAIPVVSPDALLAMNPDAILILPWNLASEISGQLRAAGFKGRLAIALPEPRWI
ncbi:MAG: methyltransferase domain-containing protein [Roseomonas sp.]|nr:methyltransferase domain-containing protein [Roseomonas sp.]